jgi:ABC-type uncharacterized transport system ATPase subunit
MSRTAEIVEQVAPKAHFAPDYAKTAGRSEVQTACTRCRPRPKGRSCSRGKKQQVEILRLLNRQSTILIFDELIGQKGTGHLSET